MRASLFSQTPAEVRVSAAMERVRRADFLPPEIRAMAWQDQPLPIGYGATTSQPSLIAQMVAALELEPGEKVLEVGTGCGYQTALLAEVGAQVWSMDIVEPLATGAAARLAELGYTGVHVRAGDGALGWPEAAPFDAVVVCAACPEVPPPLLEQLAPGGRLVIPVGAPGYSRLRRLRKGSDGTVTTEDLMAVSFVPLAGVHGAREPWRGWP